MKAADSRRKYGGGIRGKVAKYFLMRDDSFNSYLVEIIGGVVIYLSSRKSMRLNYGYITNLCEPLQ